MHSEIYKGGVARWTLCKFLGLPAEKWVDIDKMSHWGQDKNCSDAGGGIQAFMETRDVSINEVVVVDGVLYWTPRAERSFRQKRVTLVESKPRAFFRAARFAARMGFSLDLSLVDVQAIRESVTDGEWHDEAIHQWSKSIEENCEEKFLDLLYGYWHPRGDQWPLWGLQTYLDVEYDLNVEEMYYQDIEMSWWKGRR